MVARVRKYDASLTERQIQGPGLPIKVRRLHTFGVPIQGPESSNISATAADMVVSMIPERLQNGGL